MSVLRRLFPSARRPATPAAGRTRCFRVFRGLRVLRGEVFGSAVSAFNV